MATTTPLNAWPVPTSTDYVKDGATAIEALGDAIDTSVGSGLLAWQSWAPTLGGGWLNGNGVWSNATYAKLGKIVFFQGTFTLGTTTTKGSGMNVSLPATARFIMPQNIQVTFVQSTTRIQGFVLGDATTTAILGTANASTTYLSYAATSSTVPFTWATGDSIFIRGTYEAA